MRYIVFGLHTAQMKKWITQKEANAVKAFFGLRPDEVLAPDMTFYQKGLTKIWIEEISGKSKKRYYIHVIVNFARLLQISNYCVMPYTTANMKKVISAVNKILKNLSLLNGNDKFSDWTVERFDSAFDMKVESPELFMWLLNYSVVLTDKKKKCELCDIKDADPEKVVYQSVRFENDSYTYNIYVKLTELLGQGVKLTEKELQEVQNLVRVERQNRVDAVKKLLPNRKVGDLASERVRENILKVMLDEMKMFFGEGDFYSWKRLEEKYCPDYQEDVENIKDAMKQITDNSLMKVPSVYTKEVAEIFERLGIAPAGIRKEAVEFYHIYEMEGIYHRIIAEYPRPRDRRQYNKFPVPKPTKDGRVKADITLYQVDDKRRPLSIAGRSVEEYERKVFKKIGIAYVLNGRFLQSDDAEVQKTIQKSRDSILRFYEVIQTKAVKEKVAKFIEEQNLRQEE